MAVCPTSSSNPPGAESLPSSQVQPRVARSLQFVLFATSITWTIAAKMLAARAARGLTVRFQWSDEYLLLEALLLLFLLVTGFSLLQGIAAGGRSVRETIGLPRRPTARTEWATGVALGWASILVAVVPIAIAGDLHVRIWVDGRTMWLAALNLITVALIALAAEIALRGYAYRRLIEAIGPVWATIVVALISVVATMSRDDPTLASTAVSFAFATLLCVAWLRTHGLWLGWGLHFAWIASLGVVFGLPVASTDNLASLVETRAMGARWLTGGDAGPEAALPVLLAAIAAIVVVCLVSREWAWAYTRRALVPAGHPMEVAPPAAHESMERQAVIAVPALIQILPTTPQSRSVMPDSRSDTPEA